MQLLQQAVRDQTAVVMGYVDPAGVATQRVVSPISVPGDQLVAFGPHRAGCGITRRIAYIRGVGRQRLMARPADSMYCGKQRLQMPSRSASIHTIKGRADRARSVTGLEASDEASVCDAKQPKGMVNVLPCTQ